jgi:ABC-type sugar transport system substrate-binding protein
VIGLVPVAAVVVLVGLRRRLWVAVVCGGVAVVVHAALQAGPWLVTVVRDLPQWGQLTVLALVVVALGANYGRRRPEPLLVQE